jgi:hypothetical protein
MKKGFYSYPEIVELMYSKSLIGSSSRLLTSSSKLPLPRSFGSPPEGLRGNSLAEEGERLPLGLCR